MDVELARKVLGLIFGVSVRDGKLTDSEIAFLDRAYESFGVAKQRRPWAMPIADPDAAAATLRGMPKDVQQEALGLLVEAAAVDGVVHDAERRFLEAAAQAVGWTSAELEERIVETLSALESP
jgi:uncharacterized tellurite resistance protein B-like protein